MIRNVTMAIVVVMLAGTMVRGQDGNSSRPVDDRLFAEAAALSGMAELSMSEVGVQKATDPALKKFSQQMIEEHTKLNQELANLAARKNITLPRTEDARAQFCAQSLMGTPRDHFDKCYTKAQLNAHKAALAAFEAEAERGQDPDMKALASRAVKDIKKHLEKIQPIADKHEKKHSSEKEHASK